MISRLFFILIALAFTSTLFAQNYKAKLIGYNQSLPVISNGIGYITANYDGEFLRIKGVVQNLEGNFQNDLNDGVSLYRGVHGTKGVKIESLLPFVDSDGKGFELLEIANRFELSEDEVLALNNNELYINVGTDLHTNGEIRAQLVPLEAEVYYCTLFGSGGSHPVPTRGHGSVLVSKVDDTLSISGAFRDLEGDFNTQQVGEASLKSEFAGTDGSLLSNLVVESDTVSNAGIIRNADNIIAIEENQASNLTIGGIYVDVKSDKYTRAELRGQALPAAKQLYLANLRSYNAIPFNNSRAVGKVVVQRNHGDSLYLSGSFHGLESSVNTDFAGGTILYDGIQGQEGSVKELLQASIAVGGRFGSFYSSNNFYEYLPVDLEKLDNNEFHIAIHTESHFEGEIRGQLMPLGQNSFSVVMNDIQTEKANISGHKAYVDAVQLGDKISFSGSTFEAITNVISNGLSLCSGQAGVEGDVLLPLTISQDDQADFTIISKSQNTFNISDSLLQVIFDRGTYLKIQDATQNEVIRGQVLPIIQSMYFAPLSDRQHLHQVNSQARGMLIIEQHADSELKISGSFTGLNSKVSDDITGNILLYEGHYGELGTAFRALIPSLDPDEKGGLIHTADNTFLIQNARADSLQKSGLYISVLTEDLGFGELRGQILELADAYYNTRFISTNVIPSSTANGSGLAMFLRNNERVNVIGSFDGLDGIVDFTNNGGISIKEAAIDSNGAIKFLLFPDYSMDSLSGVFAYDDNTLYLGSNDVDNLNNENLYLELRKTSQDEPALRGQIQTFKRTSPLAAEMSLPINRDTILFDGLITDELIFSFTANDENTTSLRISERPDFLTTSFAHNFGIDQNVVLTYQEVDNLLNTLGQDVGDTLRLYYKLVQSDGADYNDGEIRSLYCVRGMVTEVPDFYHAHLTANHVTPPRQSSGYGNITASVLDSMLSISGSIVDMMGIIDTMHIHIGMAGVNGPAILPLKASISTDGKSAQLNSFENRFKLTSAQLDTLKDRGLYINVHTSLFANGEIRGQILPEADAYYYVNLLGSNNIDAYSTDAYGAMSIEIRDDLMTVTGSYNNLDSPYNFDAQGGAHLNLGLPGQSGPTLFNMSPIELDSVNGIFEAQSNTFTITETDIEILNSRNLYADIHTIDRVEGAIRGMVTPILKGVFRANLGSVHHADIRNDYARGRLQVDLDIENNIGVYGSFEKLPSNTDDFAGYIKYRYGFNDEINDIMNINANFIDQDSTSGMILYENNQLELDDDLLEELLLRSHHVNIDVVEGYGGIRGQVLGLAQQYYSAKMTGYQNIPSNKGGEINTVYMEYVNGSIHLSGAVADEASTISVHSSTIGNEGDEIVSFSGIDVNGDFLIDPYISKVALDDAQLVSLNNQSIYTQSNSNTRQIRGQVVSDMRFVYFGILSGINPLISIDTDAEGRVLMLSKWDGTHQISGVVSNLSGGLLTSLNGGMHLHNGLPGMTGEIEAVVPSTQDGQTYNISDFTLEPSVRIDSLLQANALYFNVHSLDFSNGEIRSQMRPLSNYHYTATLNSDHLIANSTSNAVGKLNLDIAGTRSSYYGSYRDLDLQIGDANTASEISYNLVHEGVSPVSTLSVHTTSNTAGEWKTEDNIYRIDQNNFDALENRLAHVSLENVLGFRVLRGRFIEEINQFPNASNVVAATPVDTLYVEGSSTEVYSTTWSMAQDDEELMYKYQLSTSASFENLIFESNTANNNAITVSLIQLQTSLTDAGVEEGDTVDLYQRILITDGSEESYSNTSSFVVVKGVVADPTDSYRVYLSGYQQARIATSRGQGNLDIVLQGNVMTVSGSFSGLEASLASQINGGAHIQIGLAGEEGPIMHSLTVDSGADSTSGDIDEFENIFTLSDEEILLIKNREAYVSIYSTRYTTGELRGQILPIADDYFISAINTSQVLMPDYTLDQGQIVAEIYSDSIWISGSIHHATDASTTYALYEGLAGQEGQKIVDLHPSYSADGLSVRFLAHQNKIENTPEIISLLEARAIYISTSTNTTSTKVRGQILPEVRAVFYSHLSGLKTVSISNSLAQGRVLMELGKSDELYLTGIIDKLEGTPSQFRLQRGLPGMDGPIISSLVPEISPDQTELILRAESNMINATPGTMAALINREFYLQVNSNNDPTGELRGQLLAMAPIYAECVLTGSQISANQSSRAHGLIEMEIHPQEMNALGAISDLSIEIDDIEYINATAALEGALLGSLQWQNPEDGVVTMALNQNRRAFNQSFLDDIIDNEISIRLFTVEHPLGAARGLLMPPAQALFVAPLSSAALTDRTLNSSSGIAMLILRNDNQIKYVAGADGIEFQSLRFLFGRGLPGVIDDNPFTFLGFQQSLFNGVIFNNNNINNFTDQIINDLRTGLNHVKISSFTNNVFTDYIRGQVLPIGHQSYQGTFTNYHPKGATTSPEFGKVKAVLNGNKLSIIGHSTIDESDVISVWIGSGGVNEKSSALYAITINGNDIGLQSNNLTEEEIDKLTSGEINVVIATSEYPNGSIRAQLLPDINYYPAGGSLDTPTDGATIMIEGNADQLLTIDWAVIEDPDELKYVWELATDIDFADIVTRVDRADNDFIAFTYAELDTLLREQLGLVIGDDISLYHRLVTSDGSEDLYSESFNINLSLEELVDVDDNTIAGLNSAILLPNITYHGKTLLQLDLSQRSDIRIDIYNANGSRLYSENIRSFEGIQSIQLDMENLSGGKYQVVLSDSNGGLKVLDWIIVR